MRSVLQRIKLPWNLSRVLFVVTGIFLVVQAISTGSYAFLLPGLYFFSMGFLALGCAGGNCYLPPRDNQK